MRNELVRAMLLMMFAMLILPGWDAVAQWLSGSISAGQIAFARFAFQTLFMLPLLYFTDGKWTTSNLPLHGLRGALIAVATLLFFHGLMFLPLADAIAIFFIEPMLVTVLSVLLLGETVGRRRIAAIIVGFIGAIIVIRPSFATVGWAVLFPVAASFCFSFYILLTRKLSANEHPIRMQFFAGVAGTVVVAVALFAGSFADIGALSVVRPTASQLQLLILLGFIGASAHLCVVHAYRTATVSLLAPFQYIEIVGATILGLVLFQDFPDKATWVGISLIVGAGIFIFRREAIAGRGPRSAVS